MFAVAQPGPSDQERLDAVSHAFFVASREAGGPFVLLAGALLAAFALAWLLWRARRETRSDSTQQAVADTKHLAALAEADTHEHHDWVRVPAHLRLTLQQTDAHGRTCFEECETQDVSGGWVTFLTHARPRDGVPLAFALDLHEHWPLRLQGVVHHVEASAIEGAPSLVAVKLGPIAPAVQEQLVRWVTQEEMRGIAASRRGALCAGCGRPLADDGAKRHATCARVGAPEARADEPPSASPSVPVPRTPAPRTSRSP
jgi:hypothetical protein